MKKQYLNVQEAAEMVGLHENTIRRYINMDLLNAVKTRRKWLIPLMEIERLLQEGIPAIEATA